MPAGRPSKLTPEIIERANDYLQNFEKYGDVIPSAAGLAVVCEVSEQTVYNWDSEAFPEFLGFLGKLKTKQQQVLLSKGLTGDFNSTITKLILTKHGYSDRVEQTGVDGGPIKTETTWTVKVVDA
jgi:hypothetical protein